MLVVLTPDAATTTAAPAITQPRVRPPISAPATNQPAVCPNFRPRPASAIGVICDSIESPQGDHVERAAAASASTTPIPLTITSSSLGSSLRRQPVATARRRCHPDDLTARA